MKKSLKNLVLSIILILTVLNIGIYYFTKNKNAPNYEKASQEIETVFNGEKDKDKLIQYLSKLSKAPQDTLKSEIFKSILALSNLKKMDSLTCDSLIKTDRALLNHVDSIFIFDPNLILRVDTNNIIVSFSTKH